MEIIGLIESAENAKIQTEEASVTENIELAYLSAKSDNYSNGLDIETSIELQLDSIYGENKTAVTYYTDYGYYVEIRSIGNYLIEDDGNVIKTDLEVVKETTPEGWKIVTRANFENEWYAYTDSTGKVEKVNSPKLAKGMYAIKYIGDENTINDTLISGSRWANAMTKDGSMWVWIPRYAYKITYANKENKSSGGTIQIAFLKDKTNEFLNNSHNGEVKTKIEEITYTENEDGTLSQDQWLLEPAFSFANKNLSGFWFAKFEASNTEGYGDSANTANSTNLTLKIQPSVKSWRNITAKNAFNVCMNIKNTTTYFDDISNIDTHLMRNSEWGAVAYLAHSTYGLNGIESCNNADYSYRTGSSSGTQSSWGTNYNVYNSIKVTPASTSKNIYGVYDMSGGAHEYVAGCLNGYSNILTDDAEIIRKYIEIYESKANNIKHGDAIKETAGWFGDYNTYFWTGSGMNVFVRGFAANFGPSTGLFAIYTATGDGGSGISFRPVCVIE